MSTTMGRPGAATIQIAVTAYRDELAEGVRNVLTEAFFDDPMMTYMLPDADHRRRVLPRYFASVLRVARGRGVIRAAVDDGEVQGAIIGMPPGTYPLPLLPQLREVRTIVAAGLRATLTNFFDVPVIDAVRPKAPYWYVMFLGTSPAHQRSGIGALMLQEVFERAEADALPVYLSTMKERNVAYYQRFGFELRNQLTMGKRGPATWTMLRPAMSGGSGLESPEDLTL